MTPTPRWAVRHCHYCLVRFWGLGAQRYHTLACAEAAARTWRIGA